MSNFSIVVDIVRRKKERRRERRIEARLEYR
jgi:hypothetical protein